MTPVRARQQSDHKFARILIVGFTLVIVLLIGAALAAIRNARSVQRSAAALAQEQLLTTRLINELQLEQAALNALSHQFTHSSDPIDEPRLRETLRQTEDVLRRVVAQTSELADRDLWEGLQRSAHAFSGRAREILNRHDWSQYAMEELFTDHSRILEQVAALLASSSIRAARAEARIAQLSGEGLLESLWIIGAALALSILCAYLTGRGATRFLERQREHEAELSRVSWHMLESQEDSLRRFSHELHDDLGQSLAVLSASVEKLDPIRLEGQREQCLSLIQDTIATVRELSQLLRPVILDDFGLDASLRWVGERFAERTRIRWRYESTFTERLPDEVETHLFRITQEALTNAARHSEASEVHVELRRRGGGILLRIRDDGRGLEAARADERPVDPEAPPRAGLGLVGMRARARQIGGDLRILSPPTGGVTIEVTVLDSALNGVRPENTAVAG
ncbi:MAG: hypothetical protein GC160_12600 [Acidobacteria bacterium]|nr:hypothetical protein [Acidobacteriota bacterium]